MVVFVAITGVDIIFLLFRFEIFFVLHNSKQSISIISAEDLFQ